MSSAERGSARLYLVRHAAVDVRPGEPPAQWHLSPEGRAAAESLAGEPQWAQLRVLYTSPEPKAVGTAQRIAARHGLAIRIEPDLREVERDWVEEGLPDHARRYFAGDPVGSWEPREAALARARGCIDGIVARERGGDAGVVSHGLALTLYLTDLLTLDASATYELWSRLRVPDVAVVDPLTKRLAWRLGDAYSHWMPQQYASERSW